MTWIWAPATGVSGIFFFSSQMMLDVDRRSCIYILNLGEWDQKDFNQKQLTEYSLLCD